MLHRLIALALLLLTAPAALANDGTWGGTGSDLVPLEEKRIRMAREDILIEYVPVKKYGPRWLITANYEFHNPTDASVTVVMGFPERFCDGESDCGSPDNHHTFFDMKTTVDGKPAPVRIGNVSREAHDWAPELGRVHLFDVTIAPGATTKVVHTYHHGYAGSSMGDSSLYYITKTGSLWNGPIDHARFTIRFPYRPWGLVYPKTYNLKSYATRGRAGKLSTELVFEQERWTPTQDLYLSFGSPMTLGSDCPQIHPAMLGEALETPSLAAAREHFGQLDDDALRRCRNLPYAVHGYAFKDKELQKFFYRPGLAVSGLFDSTGEPKEHLYLPFYPNPSFEPGQLGKDEHAYIKLVQLLEAERKKASRSK